MTVVCAIETEKLRDKNIVVIFFMILTLLNYKVLGIGDLSVT